MAAGVDSARRLMPSSCFRSMMKWTTRTAILVSSNGSPWNR